MLDSWSTENRSVNQPEAGHVPPANLGAAPGGQGGQNTLHVLPFPYQPDEVIGGDSVLAIERRLLSKSYYPSSSARQIARLQAEDLFEVKVEIIKLMTGLDPTGDWIGRGARALDNPRTATGEESLDKLYYFLDEKRQAIGLRLALSHLKSKVFLRCNDYDQNSSS